ncbi:MAG: hypothetical protein P1P86_04600 [Bacteroidales bacterium]|nr:hypothetical protein [Bacteroidales bacterium]
MKATKLNAITKNILWGIVTMLMIFSFTSCAVNVPFSTTSVAPAAEGQVKVKRDNNLNYLIKIKVSNLVEVERLKPAKQTYVVWMVTDQEYIKNIGQLNSSKAFMSKKLIASFETVSSTKPIEIFITAENDGSTGYPSDEVVLKTNRF